MTYNIKLEIFEGPLDLLLHLVKKNEVDIYSIQISTVVEQYMSYLEMMKELNLDVAGEFLVMAASLVHLKSRLLLPASDEKAEEEEEDGIGSREELIRRLVEYQRYKLAAEEISGRLVSGRDVFLRGSEDFLQAIGEDAGLVNVSVFELMDAFRDILKRAPKARGEIEPERFKIADKINHIMDVLRDERSSLFTSLFPRAATRPEVIVTFLAILELAKLQLIRIFQSDDRTIRVYLPETKANGEGENGQAKA